MALLRETIFKPSPDYKAFFLGGYVRGGSRLSRSRLSSHGERNYRKLLEIQNTADLCYKHHQASISIKSGKPWRSWLGQRMMVSIRSFMFLVWRPIPFSGWRKRKCHDLAFRDVKGLCIHGSFKLKAHHVELASTVQAKCKSLRQEVEEHAALRNKAGKKKTNKNLGDGVSLGKTIVKPVPRSLFERLLDPRPLVSRLHRMPLFFGEKYTWGSLRIPWHLLPISKMLP